MVPVTHECVPSTSVSLTAVVVTVWATFQLALVNVSGDGAKVHWSGVAGSAAIVTVTLLPGWAVSTTVNAPVAPVEREAPASALRRLRSLQFPLILGEPTSLRPAEKGG